MSDHNYLKSRLKSRKLTIEQSDSNYFLFQVHSLSDPPAEGAVSGGSPTEHKKEETLYDWMRRLQAQASTNDKVVVVTNDNVVITIEPEGLEATVTEPEPIPIPATTSTKSLHLLDAHIIFEPLLSSLGLMPQQIQNLSLKNLGSNVSVLANIAEFRFFYIYVFNKFQ